jgi:YegS/Rv2252/BmrU family lipid kinase
VRVAVIVNPASGRAPSPDRTRRRADLAGAILTAEGVEPEVLVSQHPGHARELAREAIARGASIVFAWGGDGTVNEVGSALAFGEAALAIVPAGSGNGLARALNIPRDPAAALRRGLAGPVRRIDVGEIDGRLFLNIAGVGFDARIAERFAREGGKRGLRGYAVAVARELFTYRAEPCQLTIDSCVHERTAFLLVIANGPQWGNGASVAPGAQLDDGLLDLVSVAPRSPLRAMLQIRHLFTGTFARLPGVTTQRVSDLEITGRPPVAFHVDGQPGSSTAGTIAVRVHPLALGVCA